MVAAGPMPLRKTPIRGPTKQPVRQSARFRGVIAMLEAGEHVGENVHILKPQERKGHGNLEPYLERVIKERIRRNRRIEEADLHPYPPKNLTRNKVKTPVDGPKPMTGRR